MHALWAGIDNGDYKAVKELLASNPKVLRWERDTYPVEVYAASKQPDHRILDLLAEHQGMDCLREYGDPVAHACQRGKQETLDLLLQRDFPPDGNSGWWSPLHNAARRGELEMVSSLLDHGASAMVEDSDRLIPLEVAAANGHDACADLLRKVTQGERITFRNPRNTKGTIEIDITSERGKIAEMITRALSKRAADGSLTGIALHGSGYQGFVEIGFHQGAFDINQPDCGADMSSPRVERLDLPEWKEPYRDNNRIIVSYGGKKPWNKTTRSSAVVRDEPFFRFLKEIMLKATKDGLFDDHAASDCLFGVQTYYFHHFDFWDSKGKKMKIDAEMFRKMGVAIKA